MRTNDKNREVSFPIKTRIPKDTNVVIMADTNAWKSFQMAKRFAPNGRIVSTDEIIDLRSQSHNEEDAIWKTYITTDSTEYLGLDKQNKLVMAWLPNFGPLKNEELFASVYKETTETPKISKKIFLEILEGKFGPFHSIPFEELFQEENEMSNKNGEMNIKSAVENKLLLSRLNAYVDTTHEKKAKEYINVHEEIYKNKLHNYCSIECNLEYYHKLTQFNFQEFATISLIIFFPLNNGKARTTIFPNQTFCCFGSVYNNEPIHSKRGKILEYLTEDYKQAHKLPKCFVSTDTEIQRKYWQIQSFNYWYFTIQEETLGNTHTGGSPVYLVTSLKKVGERRITSKEEPINIKQIESNFYFEKALWNFYEVTQIRNEDNLTVWYITYYQGTYDNTRMIPSEEEILSSPKLLGRII